MAKLKDFNETLVYLSTLSWFVEKIFSFEVMDGCPAKDVAIPIRIPLGQYKNITSSTEAKHFDVSYFLNVTIVDTEDRRYFKQTDVKLYRESLSYCCD